VVVCAFASGHVAGFLLDHFAFHVVGLVDFGEDVILQAHFESLLNEVVSKVSL
jgi:hypothetical protein